MKLLRDQQGMALLLVLVIVALLSALLTEFSFSTLVDLRSAENFRDRTKAFYLARGGVEAARMILGQDRNGYDHPSEPWGSLPTVPVGEGTVGLKIEDLSGRLYLNNVVDSRSNPLAGYHRFLALCQEVLNVSQPEAKDMADSLMAWTDPDPAFVSPDDSYYAGLSPPYARKRGKLDTVDELLLVRHFDADKVQKLKDYVRVVGDDTVNINTAPAVVLYAWQFSSGQSQQTLDDQDIAALVDYRAKTPFEKIQDLNLVPGIGSSWAGVWPQASITVKGTVYQATSVGRINEVSRVAQAVIQKSGNKLLSLKVE